MRICIAQTKPFPGDIASNIAAHKNLIALAAAKNADIIIFPELSITGYEPALAKELTDDPRIDEFQRLSNQHNMIIGIGAPTKDVCITMVLFHPHQPHQTYYKKYLHADEEPFFESGHNDSAFINNHPNIALAICYEISVPEHAENAKGANIYIASVAKTAASVSKAIDRLAEIARHYSMTVLMCNSVGPGYGGKSSVWNDKGMLVEQLDDETEGILIYETQ